MKAAINFRFISTYIRAIKTTYFFSTFYGRKTNYLLQLTKKGEMRLEGKSDKLMKGGYIF